MTRVLQALWSWKGDGHMRRRVSFLPSMLMGSFLLVVICFVLMAQGVPDQWTSNEHRDSTATNAVQLVRQGRQIFRFDTFGDQAFWGDTLKLHQAIEGSGLGGVGPGVSPKTALSVGLKVDVDALPNHLLEQIQHGRV